MNKVIDLQVLNDFKVKLTFKDGEEKVVNLKPFFGKGFTRDLLNPEEFQKVFIEPGGGIAWENGFDFCPNFLRELQDERHLA